MSKFAPEELVREAYKLLATDKARLSGLNYPVYKGQTVSPMSSLTQRSRDLREKTISRPAPYSDKIQTVLGRNNQGLSQGDMQGLIDRLSQSQRTFAQGPILRKLQQQFPSEYPGHLGTYNQRTDRDIGRASAELGGSLRDIQKASSTLEASRNNQIVKSLQGLQQDKQNRREGLTTLLDQFGNQKHAYNNMVIQGDRNRFNQEADEPFQKMRLLEEALAPHADALEKGYHPDIASSKAQEIAAALRAYGVDPSRPADQWNSTRQSKGTYPGQLVAPLPPEIKATYDVLGRTKANLRDNYTDKRRALTNELVGNDNLSARALQNLPPAMQGQVDQIEREARDRMKKDLASISNQYVKLGQYGSPQHIADVERRTRDLNKAVLEQRNKILQNSLTNQLQLQHGNEISNIGQLNQLGQQSHKDYGDLMKGIKDLNQIGANKFSNDQREHEELYKNYQNERAWEWPHMRATARNEGFGEGRSNALGEVFRGLEDRNISLDNLARLNTSYSEMQRDSDRYRQDLLTAQQARDALQRQLATYQQQAAGEQQRLAAQRAAEQQRLASERAAAERAAAERARLESLQRSQSGVFDRRMQLVNELKGMRFNFAGRPFIPGIPYEDSRGQAYEQNYRNILQELYTNRPAGFIVPNPVFQTSTDSSDNYRIIFPSHMIEALRPSPPPLSLDDAMKRFNERLAQRKK